MLDAWRRKRYLKKLSKTASHHCFTCDYFQMTVFPNGETGNRFCKYTEITGKRMTAVDWVKHVCQRWKIAEDIEQRRTDIWGAVT